MRSRPTLPDPTPRGGSGSRAAAEGTAPRRWLACAALLAAASVATASCAAARPYAPDLDGRPDLAVVEIRARPDAGPEAAAGLAESRRLTSLGRPGEAFRVLAATLDAHPGFLEGERALQDLLAGTRSDAWVRRRYESMRERAPGDADAAYLAGRLEPGRVRQAELFDAALAADPGHPWARLGKAVALDRSGDSAGAVREAWRAAAEAPWMHLPWLFLGTAALTRGNPTAAVRLLRESAARAPLEPRPWSALAVAYDELGLPAESARAAVEGLRRAPGDPAFVWALGRLLERRASAADLREVLAIEDAVRATCGEPADVELLRGRVLHALGRPAEAEAALLLAQRNGASAGEVAVPLRRARMAQGRAAEAVDGYLTALPGDVTSAGDARAASWTRLRREAAAYAPGDAGSAVRLSAALEAVGWIDEATDLVGRALAARPADPQLAARKGELAAFLGFLGDLDDLARELRRRGRRGDTVSLDETLRRIGERSRVRLGVDASEGVDVHSYAFLGAYATSAGSTGAFHDVFASRGLVLVLGARSGRGAELILARLVSDRPGRAARAIGGDVVYDERWIESDGLPDALAGLHGGLAGLTLDRSVFLQLDVIRRPSPRQVPEFPFLARPAPDDAALRALDTPSDVARRIEQSLAAGGATERAGLDAVLRHERVHVLDAARLLPPWRHPFAVLSLAFSHGLDGAAVEQWLEAHAAVGALVDADEPRAALASLLAFLPAESGDTPHVAGYREAVTIAVDEILRDRVRFSSIDVRWNVAQQMDRLTSDQVRELGRRVLARME